MFVVIVIMMISGARYNGVLDGKYPTMEVCEQHREMDVNSFLNSMPEHKVNVIGSFCGLPSAIDAQPLG